MNELVLVGHGLAVRPLGIVWMRGFLRSLASEGRAVFVSSHLMSELEGSATHLIVIGRGRLVADSSVADLIGAASTGRVALRTTARDHATALLAGAGATVAVTGPDTLTVSGPGVRARRCAAGRGRGAVRRGVLPPGDARGGLHGADQRVRRVPGRAAPEEPSE